MVGVTLATDVQVGELVRQWRDRRRRSQLELSIAAGLSTRHLSFIETGRSNPSRQMIERLCDELDVPLRERNTFHLAAGFAPVHPERPLTELGAAQAAVDAVLSGSEPNPALAVNVRWEMLAANRPMQLFLGGIADHLLEPPVNVLRATLHPDGLAPRIRNFEQWRSHAVRRVRRQLERTAAEGLADLLAEIEAFPVPSSAEPDDGGAYDLVLPMQLSVDGGELAFHYALTVFGGARDVTLDEIAIETFFPADDATAAAVKAMTRR